MRESPVMHDDDLDAHALVVVAQNPRFAGQVEFAKDVDAVRADVGGVAGANEFVKRVARGAVAVFFCAFETFGMNAEHGNAGFFGNAFADGAHVVADQADDARRINKRRLGRMVRDEFEQRGFEFFLAAEDHVHFLQVGGKTVAMQLRAAGQRAANVPGVSRAADRPVDDVQRVGNRIQHHARTAENTGALADRAGDAGLAAGHFGEACRRRFGRPASRGLEAVRSSRPPLRSRRRNCGTSRPFIRSSAHSSMTLAPMLR